VEVVVEDDGRGLDLTTYADALTGFGDQDSAGTHLGLRFMRERAESVGGVFQASSTPGQGTKIMVRVPLRPPSL
jgi:signal transduction histidine kinase